MSIDINSSPEQIYKVLTDESVAVKWDLAVESQEKLEGNRFLVHTTIGDMISETIEEIENKSITIKIEQSLFTKMGYILKPVGDYTEVIGWAEFDIEKNRNILEKVGGLLLESLKKFVEYIEDGGDIEEFDKKAMLVSL